MEAHELIMGGHDDATKQSIERLADFDGFSVEQRTDGRYRVIVEAKSWGMTQIRLHKAHAEIAPAYVLPLLVEPTDPGHESKRSVSDSPKRR
jgi:hypothetical protein